jgi:hypothetical protein
MTHSYLPKGGRGEGGWVANSCFKPTSPKRPAGKAPAGDEDGAGVQLILEPTFFFDLRMRENAIATIT